MVLDWRISSRGLSAQKRKSKSAIVANISLKAEEEL
jgi:hypothetical protein